MAEAELIAKYGPAFADSYQYEDRVRVAKVLETIRKLHNRGHTVWNNYKWYHDTIFLI